MSAPFEPESLRALARGAERRATLAPIVYAIVAFAIGLPFGALARVGLNGIARLDEIRSREDAGELVHSDDKRGEVLSLFHGTPTSGAASGLVLAIVGVAAGFARRSSLKLAAQTGYGVLALHEQTKRAN